MNLRYWLKNLVFSRCRPPCPVAAKNTKAARHRDDAGGFRFDPENGWAIASP